MINLEEQKTKTYKEIVKLLEVLPFKYNFTRVKLKETLDLLNQEVWKLESIKVYCDKCYKSIDLTKEGFKTGIFRCFNCTEVQQ